VRLASRSAFKTLQAEDRPISKAPSMKPLHPSAQLHKTISQLLLTRLRRTNYSAFAKMQLPPCSSSLNASRKFSCHPIGNVHHAPLANSSLVQSCQNISLGSNLGFLFSFLNSSGRIFFNWRKVARGEVRSRLGSEPKNTEKVPPPSLGSWTSDSVNPNAIFAGERVEVNVGTSFSDV
jgi:hypothetical protein